MIQIAYRPSQVSKIFIEAHIADIHFGATNPRYQYQILREQFIDQIRQLPYLDIISIDGDIFHHKFMANSDAIMFACNFIQDLIEVCRQKNATLLIIAGTALHDADQLKLFYHYIGNGVDIRIIEQMRFEYVKGKKILIIPELYGKGKQFYDSFLRGKELYDACYMHGTYMGSIYGKDVPDLDSSREPVFCMDDFRNCLGPIISGHVHRPGCFGGHFYYCGSPYRWQFGEEEDKGYLLLLHNIKTREYYVDFEPITSYRYDTINLDDMLQSDPKEVIDYINQKKSEGIEHIRVQFTESNDANLSVIKESFRNNPNVVIDSKTENQSVQEAIQESVEQQKDMNFIFDKSISPMDKLIMYIKTQEKGLTVTSDDLIQLLSDEL